MEGEEKSQITWKLNNDPQVKERFSRKQNCTGMNEIERAAYGNLWDASKSVLRGKIIAFNVSIKTEERPQSIIYASKLTQKKNRKLYRKLSANKQTKNRREKKNEIKNKKKMMVKNWFIEKMNKIDKTLAR